MRVLAIAPEFTSMEGGTGIYISELARRFPRDSELHILTSTNTEANNAVSSDIAGENVVVHRLSGSTASLREDFTFKMNVATNVRKFVRDLNVDVIHTSSRMPDAFCSPKNTPIPIITTVHSTIGSHLNVLTSSGQFGSAFSKRELFLHAFGRLMVLAENQYYRSGRHFICVSNWGKRDLVASKGVDESRISTIPNGVDVKRFSPTLRDAPNHIFPEIAAMDSVKVLYVGRFTFAKGFQNLLRTIKMAMDNPQLHFVIAGSGQHAVPTRIADKCTLVGQVPHKDIQYLYAACDVLVTPSLYENMPFTILEAMASGCVPVASNVGGIGEVIYNERNGLLVPPGSSEAMTSALQSLSQDQHRMRDMAKTARESIVSRFRIERVIGDTMALFAGVCAEGIQLRKELRFPHGDR